jgi:Yersinia/Haemophilus virulence surface antigen
MSNEFVEAAKGVGGDGEGFNQYAVIKIKGWAHADPNERGGAWVKGNGFDRGICAGLVLVYIACGGEWDKFKEALNSAKGEGQVRGTMNMSMERSRVNGWGEGPSVWTAYTTFLKTLARNYGATSVGEPLVVDNSHPFGHLQSFLSENDGLYYLGLYYGTVDAGGAHAIALKKSGDALTIFDPNFGVAWVSGNMFAMKLLQWLLLSKYPSIRRWIFIQFKLT